MESRLKTEATERCAQMLRDKVPCCPPMASRITSKTRPSQSKAEATMTRSWLRRLLGAAPSLPAVGLYRLLTHEQQDEVRRNTAKALEGLDILFDKYEEDPRIIAASVAAKAETGHA